MSLVPEGAWPIPDGHEVKICTCAMEHGVEPMAADDVPAVHIDEVLPKFVCSHCKLPKSAKPAVPGLRLVKG